MIVDGAGEQLLAGAGLAADEHGDIAVAGDPGGLAERLLQDRAPAENRVEAAGPPFDVREAARLAPLPSLAGFPLQRPPEQTEILREGEVIVRPTADRGRGDPVVGQGPDQIPRHRARRELGE